MAINVDISHRVQTITLNRPEALNAFTNDMYLAVGEILEKAAEDDAISVVILTGAGRAFCAGTDLNQMADTSRQQDDYVAHFPYFIKQFAFFPKPLLAAVNGLGIGIGLTLLPHCDMVYMASNARLRAPFVPLGLTVEAGNSYLLPKAIGWAQASELLYTGRWIEASEAQAMGLAYRISDPEDLLEEVTAKAREIAAMPLVSLMTTKRLLVSHKETGFESAVQAETQAFAQLTDAPANREAIAAFMEKREPDFGSLMND